MTADSQRIPIKLLLGIGFGMFLGVLSANSIPVMIGSLLDGLAITEAEVGVLGKVELLAVAIAALAAAPLAGKVSNSRLAVFGCLLAVAAQFLSAAVDSLYLLAGMRAIAGAGLGLAYAAAAMAAAATANPDRVLGYGVTAGLLAIVIFLPCLAMVVTATGYKGAYVALGLLVIVLIPVMRWLGRGKTIAAESGKAPALPVRSLVGLLLCITFFNIGSGAIWSFSERVGLQAGFPVPCACWQRWHLFWSNRRIPCLSISGKGDVFQIRPRRSPPSLMCPPFVILCSSFTVPILYD